MLRKIVSKIKDFLLRFFKPVINTEPTVDTEPTQPAIVFPIWYKKALEEIGVKETVGSAHNPRILEYHMTTAYKATDDETPWCSAFVCWCFESVGIKSTRSAWSRSYLQWGYPQDKPQIGTVCVFSRGPTSGHVGFYVSEDLEYISVLGGNQGDSVKISKYKKADLLGYRWPKSV
jgi:uncharacterized protein (TIGR02594 family)